MFLMMKNGSPYRLKADWIAVSIIALVCIIIYSNSLQSPFVFDDFNIISENQHIHLTELTREALYNAGFKGPAPNRPVANLTFALNYYFGRLNVTGYHLVNVLIHLINAILVYLLTRLLCRQHCANGPQTPGKHLQAQHALSPDRPAARFGGSGAYALMPLFVALIFVCHPIQTQSVTYTVQRMNSLAVMFYFSAFVLYVYARAGSSGIKQKLMWAGAAASWVLALGSKEIAATLPLAVGLYEWFFLHNLDRKWLSRNYKYLLGLIILLGLLGLFYLKGLPLERIAEGYRMRDFTPLERILTQLRVVVIYMGLLLFPHPSRLNLLHDVRPSHSLLDPATTLLSLLLILALVALSAGLAKKQRIISFGIIWFFIHLMIESSFIALELIFEHRLYLPMFGFALISVDLILRFFSRRPATAVVILSVIIMALGSGTFLRNRVWQSRLTLWSDVVSKSPQNYRGHYNLACDWTYIGKLNDAIFHFREALRLKPDYAKAHNNLGVVLLRQGKPNEAMRHYQQALQIDRGSAEAHYNIGVVLRSRGNMQAAVYHYLEALRLKPNFAEARNNLFIALDQQGKHTQAFKHLAGALKDKPEHAEALNNLALTFEKQGRFKEAIDLYLQALQAKPEYAVAYNNLGVVLTRLGILKEAARCFAKALSLKPDDAGMHNNLGAVLDRQGEHKKAFTHYEEALRLQPDYAQAHNNIGIVLTRRARYQEAIEHFSEALRLNPGDPQTEYNLKLALESLEKNRAADK